MLEDSSEACISVISVRDSHISEQAVQGVQRSLTFGIMVNRSKVRSGSIRSSRSDSGAVAVVGVAIDGVIEGTVTVGLR